MSLKDEKKKQAGNWKDRFKTAGKTAEKKKRDASEQTGAAKALRVLYIILTVISAIIVVAYIFWKIFAAPPSVDNPNNPNRPIATRPPPVITTTDPITGEEIEIEIPALSGDRKKEFYTFLMVGVSQDTGGGLTDTMMLAAYDVPNQKLSIMSLPRDIYVGYNQLLNSVYVYGGGEKDGKGVEALKKAVQKLTGVYPDFHAVVRWEALGELVDAIGGVEFEVPFDMFYDDRSQHFKIDLKAGKQVLDGNGAMGLVRWRQNSVGSTGKIDYSYGYREGDIGRIKTQQAFLKETIKKCLQPGVILDNWTEYLAIFQRNVVTNLTAGEMAYFAQSAVGGLKMDNVSFATLPYTEAGDGHLLPSGRQIVAAINAGFNPYEEDIHIGELQLATMDAVPKSSASPDPEDEEGNGEDDPDASPNPSESGHPGGEDDPMLPPGVLVRPGESPKPAESAQPNGSIRPNSSAQPSGSPAPSGSPRPNESAAPSGSPRPSASASPSGSPAPSQSAAPGGSIRQPENEAKESPSPASSEPPAATPTPANTPQPTAAATHVPDFSIPGGVEGEDPLLPPGV